MSENTAPFSDVFFDRPFHTTRIHLTAELFDDPWIQILPPFTKFLVGWLKTE